jgi:hypothetical protein
VPEGGGGFSVSIISQGWLFYMEIKETAAGAPSSVNEDNKRRQEIELRRTFGISRILRPRKKRKGLAEEALTG